jgi:hypothetical protein
MTDEGLATQPQLSPAEAAVNYVLRRIRVDANLRYHMLHTEAFSLLCDAEAARTGKSRDTIEQLYGTPAANCRDVQARLPACIERLESIERIASDRGMDERQRLSEIQKLAQSCP